jgi:hypothetical protein
MRGFVAACQKQGAAGGRWFIPASKAFLAVRNLTFRLMPYLPWRKMIDEMPLKVGNAIDLPDYEAELTSGDLSRRPAEPRS